MRILIVSDIHANLAAFEAVLKASQGEWEQMWFLGDLAGYGPDPNACGALLRAHDPLALTGNHDWAVLGKLSLNSFNFQARQVIEWTQAKLDEETRDYLAAQPAKVAQPPFLLAHASPRQPVWEYVLDNGTAAANLQELTEETPICLVGHTHVPILFSATDGGDVRASRPVYGKPIALSGARYLVNPGSVGQPRDGDPRAAYALLDTQEMTWEHRRVAYPIAETQRRMSKQGFPERLIVRLEYGW
ncbi:MAG: metallophosphoesterase family protein [Anaerolineae bacterium]|nr:metallophosphoesterase family protein [Anaerolineae bacterium]